MMKGLQGERLRQAFRFFDKKETGYITPEEFQRIMFELARHKLSDTVLASLPSLSVLTPGGKISYSECIAFHNVSGYGCDTSYFAFLILMLLSTAGRSRDGHGRARRARSVRSVPRRQDLTSRLYQPRIAGDALRYLLAYGGRNHLPLRWSRRTHSPQVARLCAVARSEMGAAQGATDHQTQDGNVLARVWKGALDDNTARRGGKDLALAERKLLTLVDLNSRFTTLVWEVLPELVRC